jgi:hypothetical protein
MGGKPASWGLGVVLENPGGADFKARDLQDFVVLQAVRWGLNHRILFYETRPWCSIENHCSDQDQ